MEMPQKPSIFGFIHLFVGFVCYAYLSAYLQMQRADYSKHNKGEDVAAPEPNSPAGQPPLIM